MPSSALMAHLERLLACDTQNPPRAIDGDAAIFRYCSEVVGSDFRVELHDHGDGHVSWSAVRGKPSVLFNVHLDTVPNGEGWSSDPLQLRVADGRLSGLLAEPILGKRDQNRSAIDGDTRGSDDVLGKACRIRSTS